MTLCCSFSKQIITACHADKGCHGKQFFEQVNNIQVRQCMCEACGKGNFRLPGARITSVFKITGEHNTLFPNAVQANVCFSLSGDFFLKCLAQKLLLVKWRKRLNQRTITGKLGIAVCYSKENKPLTPSMYIMVIVPCIQQNFRYWVLQQQPKAEENLITL